MITNNTTSIPTPVDPNKLVPMILLACVLAISGCALKFKSAAVNLAEGAHSALGGVQDAARAICDPAVQRPNFIKECTADSAAAGLTTARFRLLSGALAKAFDFEQFTLVPALQKWRAGDPAPKEFYEYVKLVDEVIAVARTVPHSVSTEIVFTSINVVTAAIAELAKKLGVSPPIFLSLELEIVR